jgi:FeS assembly protein IscX
VRGKQYNSTEMLSWEDTVDIVKKLRESHPQVQVEDISLEMIYHWTIELPEFSDDRELSNEDILTDILKEWFEEVNPL